MSDLEAVLAEQVAYYRERAADYEDWWFHRGRYDHGSDENSRWFSEIAQAQTDLEAFGPRGRVLELACGTGLWTGRLAARASMVTALDTSPEALRIARSKVTAANVAFRQADVFACWEPRETYDLCFFAFWLSHVPHERTHAFWQKVRRALAPGGRAYLVDFARRTRASTRGRTLQEPEDGVMLRRLTDGRRYRIIKHSFDVDELHLQLGELGWSAELHATAEFIQGSVTPHG